MECKIAASKPPKHSHRKHIIDDYHKLSLLPSNGQIIREQAPKYGRVISQQFVEVIVTQ